MSRVRTVFQPPSGVATRFLPIARAAALPSRPVLRLLKTTFATFVLPIEGPYYIAWLGRFWNHTDGRSGRPNRPLPFHRPDRRPILRTWPKLPSAIWADD